MNVFKDAFTHWQDNAATTEELQLSFDKRRELVAEWQPYYYEWLEDQDRETVL